MKNNIILGTTLAATLALSVTSCGETSQEKKDQIAVQRQQAQVAKSQPVPQINWSLERHLVIELYGVRNVKAVTHSVWRSNTGMIEGDCPSIGFGIPYDTSLTNPLTAVDFGRSNYDRHVVEQAEPNAIFASKNTSATWVMCAGDNGSIDPVYVESKVTTYPYPVDIDYDKNRVRKAGKSSVSISTK